MDIKILHSHLTEYLETDASAKEIGRCMALCGPSCERVNKYGKNDWQYEIEITTNRVDSMSVYGVAREAAAILPRFGFKAKLKDIELGDPTPTTDDHPQLEIITDPKLTNRVMGVIMEVNIGQSPQYIKDRLEATDIRSLNNLVDVTNYIMTEIGHPTHVFDYDRIASKKMILRESKKGETIVSLEDKEYTLPGGDIVIEDGNGVIIDLPGIIGTANSVVQDDTKRILFFIDNNDPKRMRKTSMTLGIRTVAVTLNEKKVDPELGETALLRGIKLYQEIAGGKVVSKIYDLYENKPKQTSLDISHKFIEDRVGVKLEEQFILNTLKTLGFKPTVKDGTYSVEVPTWRIKDIEIPEDIVEEIARINGYHNLPSVVPLQEPPVASPQKAQLQWESVAKHALKNWGWFENYTYSAVSKELDDLSDKTIDSIQIKNPLSSEWVYMRQSLVPSLIQSLKNNLSLVKNDSLKFFEMANIYLPKKNDLPEEKLMLTLVESGSDFYHLKGTLEALGEELGIHLEFTAKTGKSNDSTKKVAANIEVNGTLIGEIYKVDSYTTQALEIPSSIDIYAAQLNFQQLTAHATKNKVYIPIPKYPPIIEDLTFFNQKQVLAADIVKAAKSVDKLVHQVEIIGTHKDKINIQVHYMDKKKNLTDEDIKPVRINVIRAVEKLGTKLQGTIS